MAFVNSYEPPTPAAEPDLADPSLWGPDPYDVNYAFPVRTLENGLVKLTPFVPRLHAEALLGGTSASVQVLCHWLPWSITTLPVLLEALEHQVRRNPSWVLFAILDTSTPGEERFAGTIGLLNNVANLAAEVGPVVVLPAFQGTRVTRNAVGLLMQYALEVPSKGGIGLRRLEWSSHPDNEASKKTALRMGFQLEGIKRWSFVLEAGKQGRPVRPEDPLSERDGRHTASFAICWDDWEGGWREKVAAVMNG